MKKSLQTERQTDRWTDKHTDDRWSEKLRWAKKCYNMWLIESAIGRDGYDFNPLSPHQELKIDHTTCWDKNLIKMQAWEILYLISFNTLYLWLINHISQWKIVSLCISYTCLFFYYPLWYTIYNTKFLSKILYIFINQCEFWTSVFHHIWSTNVVNGVRHSRKDSSSMFLVSLKFL